MPSERKRKISLVFFVILTILLVGLVPLVLTGWFLSDKSGKELRSAENRYQIQLVQEKARQIEMFGQKQSSILTSLATAIELSNDPLVIGSDKTETRLGSILRENPEVAGLMIKPVVGETVAVFRPEILDRSELEQMVSERRETQPKWRVAVGETRQAAKSGAFVMPFSTNVIINDQPIAQLVAVASLQSISQGVVGLTKASESELWDSGLPIVFVVNREGRALFHPDAALVAQQRSMADLKIVQEWLESGSQVQSALVPFSAGFAGRQHEMIGAYSTANLADGYSVGVITMQDEGKALASVGEMRIQIWITSLAMALCALLVGLGGARFMTLPLLRLVQAAQRIASGDFSSRVETRNITEIGTLGESFNVMTDKIEEQILGLAKAAEENRELFVGTVKALAAAIDGKDKYTRGHSERVARISVAIGKRLGMSEDELEKLRISALLHDVGKIAVDDNILKKPAALTDDEFEIMKTHPQKGYKILSHIPAMQDFLPGIYMHHEMVNGKGYPQGLAGTDIPLQARIVSVADTFDAMTIDRPYQKGMELPAALERLRSFVGTRYSSDVVEALVEACSAGEVANGIVRQLAAIRAAADNGNADASKLVA